MIKYTWYPEGGRNNKDVKEDGMHSFLTRLLSDRKGGEVFTCFSVWHIIYIILTAAAVTAILLRLKNADKVAKDRIMKILINISFGLYILDFFLMPLAYGEIDIEKLPFHACTAMCVACFLSTHIQRLSPLRVHFALHGFISNLVYLIYPAGVMWHAVHPLSYRVVQTLIFHSIMTVYGLVTLICERNSFKLRKIHLELPVICCMTLWALIGNYVYNGTYGGKDRLFNWFFVVRDPFYALPENIALFVMPLLNIALFFGVEALIYLLLEKGVKNRDSSC